MGERRDVVTRARVQRETCRLVDDEEGLVLVDDGNLGRLAFVARRTLAQREAQARPDRRLGQENGLGVDERLAAQDPVEERGLDRPARVLRYVPRDRPAGVVRLDLEVQE